MPTFKSLACSAVLLASASIGNAATVTLDAIQDTWITPRSSTANHNNDLVSVKTGSATSTNGLRYGVLEFDLSSVPGTITDAVLQLYMASGNLNTGTTTSIARFVPLTADIAEDTLTYSIYTSRADLGPSDALFDSLGYFTFAGPVTADAYTQSSTASADDAAKLETQRLSAFPSVGFLLSPNSNANGTTHDWSDHESGYPAQLIITYSPAPEPSTMLMAVLGVLGCLLAAKRARC